MQLLSLNRFSPKELIMMTDYPTPMNVNPRSSYTVFEVAIVFLIIVVMVFGTIAAVFLRPSVTNVTDVPAESLYHNVDTP